MARSALTDYLQNFPFWLVDVAPVEPLAVPIFTPTLGFSEISAPEINVDVKDVPEGNSLFTKKVITHATVQNITLKRGVLFFDGDFWRWVIAALKGSTGGVSIGIVPGIGALGGPTPRRNLLLVHAFAQLPFKRSEIENALASAALVSSVAFSQSTGVAGGIGAGTVGAAGALNMQRMPAKAYLLKGCLPIRYRASSDFDAKNSEIAIQELEFLVEEMEEISLAA